MIKADYQTTKNFPFTLDVNYIINYASKIGRIAKKYADAKFSFSGFNDYHAVYAFKSAEVAAECKVRLKRRLRVSSTFPSATLRTPLWKRWLLKSIALNTKRFNP